MMGQQLVPRQRTELLNLEELVPQDHLLRAIDRIMTIHARAVLESSAWLTHYGKSAEALEAAFFDKLRSLSRR